MGMWIVAGVLAAIVMGFPSAPVLVIGAVAMVALAYCLSRQASLLRMGASLCFVTLAHFVFRGVAPTLLEKGATDLELLVLRFMTSDGLMLALASGVMLTSFMIGMLHPAVRDSTAK